MGQSPPRSRREPARPQGEVVRHALLTGAGLGAAAAVAVAAGLLLYATVRAPGVQLGRLALTPLDMAALGAIGVVLVGWARGSVGAQQLAGGGGTNAFLLLVPALIVFAAAIVSARLLAPALRALGRAGRRGPVALRLAAASLARNPGHAAIAATFLVASLGLALFAVGYRSTLTQGQRDEASFAVPASYVLTEDFNQLVPVPHGAQHLRRPSTPIMRLSGNVPSGTTFGFLALPRHAIATVGGWRGDFATRTRAELAAAVSPAVTAAEDGRASARSAAHRSRRRRSETTSACARSSARHSATTSRSGSATRAPGTRVAAPRSRAVPARDARPDPVRHPEQRPAHRERGHRHPAEREGDDLVRDAPHQRHARAAPGLDRATAGSAAGPGKLGYVLTPDQDPIYRPRPGDGRARAAGARDAARRGGSRSARHDSDRRRGRADRRADRRRRAAVPVDPRRRRRRRALARRRHDSTRARPASARRTSSG